MDDEKLNDTITATPVSPVPDNTPEKPSPRRSRRRWRCVKPVALVVAGIMVLNAAITLLLIQWQQPETVTVHDDICITDILFG